jgi:hypothetical protein
MPPLASHGPAPRRRDIRYAVLGEDFGEGGLPVEGFGMRRQIADDAVALADGVVRGGSIEHSASNTQQPTSKDGSRSMAQEWQDGYLDKLA